MSSVFNPIDIDATADLPPGAAPSFGDLEQGTVQELTPLVLSESAHRHMAGPPWAYGLNGPFHLDDLGIEGELWVDASPEPGLVHVHADLAFAAGGGLHYDANVRESWLARAGGVDAEHDPRAEVARALAKLATIPRQSTVTVSFES